MKLISRAEQIVTAITETRLVYLEATLYLKVKINDVPRLENCIQRKYKNKYQDRRSGLKKSRNDNRRTYGNS